MLIALFIALLAATLGGTSPAIFPELKSEIASAVDDAERRKQATELVTESQSAFQSYEKGIEDGIGVFYEVHCRYDSTKADYEAAMETIVEKRNAVQQQLLANRDKLRSVLTREEWEQVFSEPGKGNPQ